MRNLKEYRDKEVKAAINNYKSKGVTTGGNYSLAELLIEQGLRIDAGHDPRDIVDAICMLSCQSEDQLTSYKEMHNNFYPGEQFIGHASLKRVGKILGVAAAFCASQGFPALTTLVVPDATRKVKESAVQNIYNCWIDFGQATNRLNANDFYKQQLQKSKEFASNWVSKAAA